MSPEEWLLPSLATVEQTLGTEDWEGSVTDALSPIGSVMTDIGCDRHCDFCETPLYGLGYRKMSPPTVERWFAAQKSAGARSVICPSDQFLGRVLWPGGREEILSIMRSARMLGLPVLWSNGLELRKATIGRGIRAPFTPDYELVETLWGWDGKVGCYAAYLPAERPLLGQAAYGKLLNWEQHCLMVEAIVRAGVPNITYGVIVGFSDDSRESMQHLADALVQLYAHCKELNPRLNFCTTPYAIRPIPGTPQARNLQQLGLVRFSDPAIVGGFWTACADTFHLSYEEVSDWQVHLAGIGDGQLVRQGVWH